MYKVITSIFIWKQQHISIVLLQNHGHQQRPRQPPMGRQPGQGMRHRDGNFAPPRLTRPSPASPRAGFSRPTKVVGRGWGKILDPHHGAGRGWVYTF